MKKSIFISLCMVMAATAVLTSCKKDNDTVSFRATISTYQNTGKVYIDNNRFANWIDGDEVLINGATYTVAVDNSGDAPIASINGVRAVEEDGYYAIYPSECALTTPTSGFPQILLPQVQLYRNDNPTNPAQGNQIVEAPMAAYCSADREQAGLDFTNLCSLLKVELGEEMEVGYITVSSSNKPLWGKATISGTTSLSISSPEIESLYATDNTVTLDCTTLGLHGPTSGASVGVTSAGPFYIVLPPATNVADLTVSIYVFTNDLPANRRTITKYTKSANSSITIVSNKIYGIGNGLDGFEEEENEPDVPFPHLGKGEFSVSRTKKVRFALGNLQWLGNGNIWRFAPNQWDYIGQNPGNTTATGRSTQNDWIDLFGYGTSGNNGHYPWRTTTTTDQTTNYATGHISNTDNDWGVNAIINGGNQPNKWRTLTEAEWKYLLGQGTSVRRNASNLHIPVVYIKFSNTNKIRGTLIFPDGYTGTKPLTNDVIPIATWNSTYANSGAVFLPVTGQRSGQSYSNVTTTGYYWTSTYETDQTYKPFARQVYFDANADHTGYIDTYKGNGVRLVRDVN